jgi:hypothetical protein
VEESQHKGLLELVELEESQLHAHQIIESFQACQKILSDKKVRPGKFQEGNLVMVYDTHYNGRTFKIQKIPEWIQGSGFGIFTFHFTKRPAKLRPICQLPKRIHKVIICAPIHSRAPTSSFVEKLTSLTGSTSHA